MFRSSLFAEVARTGLAAGGFLLLARALTSTDFGGVSVVTAVVSMTATVGTMGLLVGVTRAIMASSVIEASEIISTVTICGTVISFLIAGPIIGFTTNWVNAIPLLMAAWAETTLALGGLVSIQTFTAMGNGAAVRRVSVTLSAGRFLPAMAMTLLSSGSIAVWASIYLATSQVIIWLVWKSSGGNRYPAVHTRILRAAAFRPGNVLASSFASRVLDDLDKLALQRLAGAHEVAMYTVPYRLIGYSLIPARALLSSRLPRFYSADMSEESAVRRGLRLAVGAAALAAAAAALILLLWPLAKLALGGAYQASFGFLALLGIACAFKAAHYCIGESLLASGRVGLRIVAQYAAVVLNAGLLLLLIPRYGVRGAAIATLLTEGVLVAALALGSRRSLRKRALT